MIRTKGEAGTGDVVEAVKHQRTVMSDIRRAAAMSDEELYTYAKVGPAEAGTDDMMLILTCLFDARRKSPLLTTC